MPIVTLNLKKNNSVEDKNVNKERNENRKSLRSTEKYKYIIRCLKRDYKMTVKLQPNPKDYESWNDVAHKNGIYYVVEQNQDIINVKNYKMVDDIILGRFDRYNYLGIESDD